MTPEEFREAFDRQIKSRDARFVARADRFLTPQTLERPPDQMRPLGLSRSSGSVAPGRRMPTTTFRLLSSSVTWLV